MGARRRSRLADNSNARGSTRDSLEAGEHGVIDVMPDWQGNYWFVSRGELLGISDLDGSMIKAPARRP